MSIDDDYPPEWRGSIAIKTDNVNRPRHYTNSDAYCPQCERPIECIDITRHMDFNLGNAIKYIWRWKDKNGLEDLLKARWYLQDAISQLEARKKIDG
jgi:hypothetical protein